MSLPKEQPGSRELQGLVELSRQQPVSRDRAELDAGLVSLTALIASRRTRHRRLKRAVPLLVALLSVVAVLVSRPWLSREPVALNYGLQGGVVLAGGYLREMGSSGIQLTFEEGTQFVLATGARARLRTVSSSGARLQLESGAASFDVIPNAQRAWEVEVGPFLVQVKGTAFDVAWEPRVEQFHLDLKHGRVLVSGPISGGDLELHAGQRLAVDLRRGETHITEGRAAQSVLTHDAAAAPEVPEQVPSRIPEPGSVVSQAEPRAPTVVKRDWARDMAQGHWDKILRQAEQAGLVTIHATASAEELFTLANAARYRQRTALARESLLILQRRFAQSARAVDALFLLGRLDESRADFGGASDWYDQYLARSPNGAYAAEALGRKMTLTARSLGADKARATAEQYVRQYPKGSYARAARALLEAR